MRQGLVFSEKHKRFVVSLLHLTLQDLVFLFFSCQERNSFIQMKEPGMAKTTVIAVGFPSEFSRCCRLICKCFFPPFFSL